MNAKQRAVEIYQQHIALATTDGRMFRKTVMDQLMLETSCTLAAAATHYNNAKKGAPIEGLGRAPAPKGLRRPSEEIAGGGDHKTIEQLLDEECYTVSELVTNGESVTCGKMRMHNRQGDASEFFDQMVRMYPAKAWVMIRGLGPNPTDAYKLGPNEKEIKRHPAM